MQAVEFNGLTNALKASLDSWGTKHKTYGTMFKGMNPAARAIAHNFLEETKAIKPGSWEVWWAREHNRFIRSGVMQRELIVLHEIMYHFLTDFSRGKLAERTAKPATNSEKAPARSKQ